MFYKTLFFFKSLLYLLRGFLFNLRNISFKKNKYFNKIDTEIDFFLFNNTKFYYSKKTTNSITLKKRIEDKFNFYNDILNLTGPCPTFIDFGAHIGEDSFVFNSICKAKSYKSEILCFEPNKYPYEILRENIKGQNCSLYNFGVFNYDKEVNLNYSTFYFSNTLSNLSKSKDSLMSIYNRRNKNKPTVLIKLKKLSDFMEKSQLKNAIVKIDTEGCEKEILQEIFMMNVLPNAILLEINMHYLYRRFLEPKKIFDGFYNHEKYNLYYYGNDRIIHKTNFNEISKLCLFKFVYSIDFIMIKKANL